MRILLTATVSYLLGSIPFGLILVRIFRGEDVRLSGSGNIGATNVARSSPALGVLTLVLDALKGLAAVALTRAFFPGRNTLAGMAALFAIVGHMFPIWLKFRGGKGVATALGSFALLAPASLAGERWASLSRWCCCFVAFPWAQSSRSRSFLCWRGDCMSMPAHRGCWA